MASSANPIGQTDPGTLSMYIGYSCTPDDSQATTGIALSVTLHNLALVRANPLVTTSTDPRFGEAFTNTAASTKLAVNVQTAPVTVTHSWCALYDLSGNCLAVTADGGVTAWGTGYQTFTWLTPVTLVPGQLVYANVVNNASGTAPKLSGIATLAAETQANLTATGGTPFRWCVNSASPGATPPVPGTSTLNYTNNSAAAGGYFCGLL